MAIVNSENGGLAVESPIPFFWALRGIGTRGRCSPFRLIMITGVCSTIRRIHQST